MSGWTQTDIDNVRAAILEIAVRGVASLTINGRQIQYSSIDQLRALLREMEADVIADTNGGMIPAAFNSVGQDDD
jgi:hypothetical protein